MGLANKLWIGCKQATYLNEKRESKSITFSERIGLAVHLMYCRFCRLFFRQINALEKYSAQSLNSPRPGLKLSELRKSGMEKALRDAL